MFKNLKLLWPYFKRYRRYFLFGTLVLTTVNILDVSLPLIIRYAIDHLGADNATQILLLCGIGFVVAVGLQGAGRYGFRIFFMGAARKVSRDMRNEFFGHIQTLSNKFFNTTPTGDIMSRATNDIEAVQRAYGMGVMIVTDIVLYFLTVPFIMMFLSVKLTLLSVIFFPILPFFVHRMGKLIHARFKEIQETFARISTQTQENFSGIRVVKSFVQEENQIKDFDKVSTNFVKQNMSLVKLQAFFSPSLQLIAGLSILAVIYFGGMETIKGNISTGTFVAFPFYLMKIMWPMMGIGWAISIFQMAIASMQRLREVLDVRSDIKSPALPIDHTIKGEVEFKDIGIVYPQATRPALHKINLKIPSGKTVALMGPLGSGKTTLVNMIPRLFDPTQGEVLIDGINIKKFAVDKLRRQIGFVPQDVFLFSESVKENISFGVSQAASQMKDIIRSAEISMVNADIAGFAQQYDTMLGERGVNISGGQKQRLTLARAIIKDPKILILDDCFSSVDTETEEAILQQLKDVVKGRTSIIISHRLAVVRMADLIVFMQDGRIAEMGTHKVLMAKKGRYAQFYEYHQLREEIE
ncbi:ABC transporter ATP-binding protein [Planctomycetota bacterium]